LEQAIEAFEPCIGVQGIPAMEDAWHVPLKTGQGISYWLQKWTISSILGCTLEKVGNAPLGSLP
jgi:hypothetical protein